MAGIFPENGVPAAQATNAYSSSNSSCSPKYYKDCGALVDPRSLNAEISEIFRVAETINGTYDCSRTDNLLTAIQNTSFNPCSLPIQSGAQLTDDDTLLICDSGTTRRVPFSTLKLEIPKLDLCSLPQMPSGSLDDSDDVIICNGTTASKINWSDLKGDINSLDLCSLPQLNPSALDDSDDVIICNGTTASKINWGDLKADIGGGGDGGIYGAYFNPDSPILPAPPPLIYGLTNFVDSSNFQYVIISFNMPAAAPSGLYLIEVHYLHRENGSDEQYMEIEGVIQSTVGGSAVSINKRVRQHLEDIRKVTVSKLV